MCNTETVVVNYGVMLSQWLLIMVCNTEPVIVNHGLLCSPKGCESWRVILGKVVVNHGVLYGASGCDSWCVIPCQWLLIMVCYADPVDVNHGV